MPRPFVTLEQYLRDEERSEVPHEYLDGEVFEMEATTIRHQRIALRLTIAANDRLKAKPCEVFAQKSRLAAPNGLYTYPDILIVCGKVETAAADPNGIVNPKVLVEVLSPSTGDYDRGRKSQVYRTIPSLSEYAIVHQDQPFIEHLYRKPDGEWSIRDIRGLESALRLESLGIEIPFTEIYPPEE